MDPAQFFAASRVLIVAGKGGVGKTTVCATLAGAASEAGLSVLIVRLTPGGALHRLVGAAPITSNGSPLRAAGDGRGPINGRLVTSDDALLDYLEDHGLQRVTKRLVTSGALDVVTTAAPGIRDLLVLGRVKQLELAKAADLIILDAPAAGHAVSFLRSPAGLRDAVTAGPIATQGIEVLEMLTDPTRCRVLLVTLPEETPVNELIETAFALEDDVGVQLGPVVVNGLAPRLESLDLDLQQIAADLDPTLRAILDPSMLTALSDAAAFRTTWMDRQREQLDRLAEQLPLPRINLPLQFSTDLGPTHLDALVAALTTGIHQITATVEQ
jgi:anion-transporting  ArsA/GET3 family ATPase